MIVSSFKVICEGHSIIIRKILIWRIFFHRLVQSGSFFTHRVPLVKVYALALNDVCRSTVKVILDHIKSFLSFTLHLALFGSYFPKIKLLGKGCAVTLNKVDVKVIADLFIFPF